MDKCIAPRVISPLRKGQKVNVVNSAPAEEFEREMFVTITWEDRTLAVPLAQSEAVQAHKAIGDWHYWVNQDYEL